MIKTAYSAKVLIITVLLLLIATTAAVVGIAIKRRKADTTESETKGFQEMAAKAGIDFHMSFLPSEQGANFKINLYDHGCGVAVADFDGDGFDDIYLVNQLGKN